MILEEGKDLANETCDTYSWCLLDSHLWSTDREEVVHLVLSEIAVLNHVSGHEPTLTKTDDVEITLSKDRVVLHLFAIVCGLDIHLLEDGRKSFLTSTNNKALSMDALTTMCCCLIDDINKVNDLSSVAHIIDAVINENW